MKLPLIIAHRGASAHAPENTMAAFERAMRDRADGVEMDVWKCASGEVVVTHNRDVQALTGRTGNVERMSFKQLRALDFGICKGAAFRRERIPTLLEVLKLTQGLELINIEIKGTGVRSTGVELDVAEAVVDLKLLRRVVVSSFNPAILRRLHDFNPAIRTGLLLYEGSPLPLRRGWSARFLNPYSLHPSLALLRKSLVAKAHQQRKKVIVWTINEIQQLQACIDCRVDGIITDDPARMINALRN